MAPIGTNAQERLERVVVAMPANRHSVRPMLALPPGGGATEESRFDLTGGHTGATEEQRTTDAELQVMVAAKTRVVDGWRVWRGGFDHDGYPRVWMPKDKRHPTTEKWLGSWQPVHRLVCGWEHGPVPKGWSVDHVCGLKDCLDHLEAVTVAENARRRRARERGELPTGHTGKG